MPTDKVLYGTAYTGSAATVLILLHVRNAGGLAYCHGIAKSVSESLARPVQASRVHCTLRSLRRNGLIARNYIDPPPRENGKPGADPLFYKITDKGLEALELTLSAIRAGDQ
jgi:DNA-binding PadR family transcriptional regulator